jgi:hypothetical protein
MKELPIPDAAVRDHDKSVEMLRAWIAEGALFCSLNIGMYVEGADIREEDAWGTILADAMRHVASGLSKRYDRSYRGALDNMKARFIAELDSPTSAAAGGFVSRNQQA